MRQLLAGLVGLLLTTAFALAAGAGVGLTFRPATNGVPMDRAPGLAWLLVAGVFLGMLVLSRRYSPTVPLVAGVALLVATLVGMASPQFLAPTSTGGAAFGMYVLNGYGLGVLFATLLLVVSIVPTGKGRGAA
ncbi:MAG TPA: hypothetical protein VIQ30_21435 [Pseudonocardia sp.]